jgi:hypothetical protein
MDVLEFPSTEPDIPVFVDDERCPRCGARAGEPVAESAAVGAGGMPCTREAPGAIWIEWHECPDCGRRFSVLREG